MRQDVGVDGDAQRLGDIEALNALHGLVPANIGVREKERPGRVP
jgi:hypothetical protein